MKHPSFRHQIAPLALIGAWLGACATDSTAEARIPRRAPRLLQRREQPPRSLAPPQQRAPEPPSPTTAR